MDVLAQIDYWGAQRAAAAVVGHDGDVIAAHGPQAARFRIASLTKLLTAYATLIGVEEGALHLDEPAGPDGATVAHLLAHTSGLGFDGSEPPSRPGTKRIYSNAGYEALAAHLEQRTGFAFPDYLREAVLEPLKMTATDLPGSAAKDARSTVEDLVTFTRELLAPQLLSARTVAEATSVQFPGLAGVLPGFGIQDPLDWGYGFEIRDGKSPHWTGRRNSPRTYGHFGGSGTFLWVDPGAGLATVVLTDREFGEWAQQAWPALSDAVLKAA